MTRCRLLMTLSQIAALLTVLCVGCNPPADDSSSERSPVVKTEDAPTTGALRTADAPAEYVPFETFVPPDEQKVQAAARAIVPQFSCQDMTLTDAVKQLSEMVRIAIDIDRRALEEIGIDPGEVRLTVELTGRDLRTVLRRLLEPIGLTWTINDGAIWVTTPDVAEDHLIIRVYDVVDLIQGRDAQDLIDQFQIAVAPVSWDVNGGAGSLNVVNHGGIRALVVRNTIFVQDEVSALLAALRRVRHKSLEDSEIPAAVDPALVAQYQQRLVQAVRPDPERDELVKNMNQFALQFYSHVARDHDGNLFFSPYSIATALGMLYGGAQGETADEIARTMQWTLTGDRLHAAFQSLDGVRLLSAGIAPGKFHVANRLWGHAGYSFKPEYTDTTLDYYGAKLARVDFDDPAEAARRINAWTESQTSGLIPESVDPQVLVELKDLVRFVLLNVVYFNYPWMDEFPESATQPTAFYIGDERVMVPTMQFVDENCRYGWTGADEDRLLILEKPYAGGNMALVVVLPTKRALARLEAALQPKALDGWNAVLQPAKVEFHLPKFKYEQAIDLKATLEKMGIRRAFDSTAAEFSAISDQERLFIGWAHHKAVVDVNEHGTEAAAVTVFGGLGGGIAEPPILFQANSPFLFYIVDKRTGCILFMGRVVDPRA